MASKNNHNPEGHNQYTNGSQQSGNQRSDSQQSGNRSGQSNQSSGRGNSQSGNRGSSQSGSKANSAGVQGGTPEQHAAAGRQSHKNSR